MRVLSAVRPEGEPGFLGAYNLVAIEPAEFGPARAALSESDAAFDRTVVELVDVATRRWT